MDESKPPPAPGLDEETIRRLREENPIGSPIADPDAGYLGPTLAGPFAIGAGLKGINDGSEALVEGLRISRHEAELLFEHWWRQYRETMEFCHFHNVSGSSESREMSYAKYRCAKLRPHCSDGFLARMEYRREQADKQLDRDMREAFEREMEDAYDPEEGQP